jgi:O-antigen ligase
MDRIKAYTEDWRANDYLVALLVLIIPIFNRLMPLLLILLVIATVIHPAKRKVIKERLKPIKPLFWFIAFYLYHLIGMSYSENLAFGWNDLGIKLSFLVVPLIIAFSDIRLTKDKTVDMIILGLFISALIAISKAAFKSIYNLEDNHWAYFTESYLAFSMHRSYYATYMAFGVLLSAERFFTFKTLKYLGAALLFAFITLLTFSKAGILIMVILMIPLLFVFIYRNWGKWIATIGSAIMVFAVIGAIWFTPTLHLRFQKMVEGVTSTSTINNTSVESNESRLIMWSTSLRLINENVLFGVGTGDVSDALDMKNVELGNIGVAKRSLNSHNQYLNTWVQLGLVGFILLFAIMITAMMTALSTRFMPFVYLIMVIALTMSFESFLETQAGIIPVTLLATLFVIKASKNEITHSDTVLSA